ncbi:MAG: DUF669 domain-containing protein [Desulfobacterales bacterium]|nr:DUF669 domain-containing protein [Desulfobacterales bacterium]
MATLNMKLDNVETQKAFDPIPAGDYLAHIIESGIKSADSGVSYIKLKWQIIETSTHKGRTIWENITITNPKGRTYEVGKSPAEIGARKIKTIAVCGNHPNPNFIRDTQELHGLPVIIKVTIKQSEGYSPQNDIKGYKQPEQSIPSVQPIPVSQIPQAQVASLPVPIPAQTQPSARHPWMP